MTVADLVQQSGWSPILLADDTREITGGYAGDLLSWVMGRGQYGDCWFTIMSNLNVIAVAQLLDVACVVFTEGVVPDAAVVNAARLHDINLIRTDEPTYAACVRLGGWMQ
ncbi:MAG: hypothetical protein IJP98_00995 [Clostridia bacterium]|nr:hypothetical protein [Clostridia bacterium]